MKFHAVLPAVLFAAVSSLAMSAHAEDAMKPHSHMEEKTGIAPKAKAKAKAEEAAPAAAEAKTEKAEKTDTAKPEKNKSKHYHPRDGK